MITSITHSRFWHTYGLVLARLIIAAIFLMACYFKFSGIGYTVQEISSIGFPFPAFFAWVAAIFELLLAVAFITGIKFKEAAILAAVYIIFLAFAFHGPSHWAVNMDEFGFFVDHFSFFAGLLFMIAHGPGEKWVLGKA